MSVKRMIAKYAGTCATCKQPIAAGSAIDFGRNPTDVKAVARHAPVCPPAQSQTTAAVVAAAPAVVVDMKPVVAFLEVAKANGKRYPKAQFLAPGGGELKLSVSGAASKVPGSIQVLLDQTWIGRIEPSGAVVGQLRFRSEVLQTLSAVAADPATAAREYGRVTCRCSFCAHPLKDSESVEMGYGPSCAARFGLTHRAKGVPELKEVPVL